MKLSPWLIAALVLWPLGGQAAPAPAAPTNDDCLTCHGDPEAARADGRKVAVDAKVFGGSVHGQAGLACVDCHADLARTADFPHPEKLARVDCSGCHGDAVAAYGKSIHAAERKRGDKAAATCVDCHGMHDILPAKEPGSRTSHLKLPETCGQCHGNQEKMTNAGNPKGAVFATFEDSIHARALNKAGLVVAPNCQNCHGNHDIRKVSDPASKVARPNIPATCGTCHQGIQALYETSVHAAALRAGNLKAAVCADCHTAHGIKAVDVPAWKLSVIQECGTCHEESIRTYRDTFHGQVTSLGFVRVASCADCHGAHDIHKKEDPASRVASANLVQTCSRCHPGANANFVRFDPHADTHDPERNPVLFWTARFMKLLLAFTFTFFGIHTGLWLPRSWKERQGNGGGAAGEGH